MATKAELEAELKKLKAENEKLKSQGTSKVGGSETKVYTAKEYKTNKGK